MALPQYIDYILFKRFYECDGFDLFMVAYTKEQKI